MSILKKLFGFNSKPKKGRPIKNLRNEVHIKRIENYTQGGRYAHFHFPGFENDTFIIEIIEDEFTQKRILKPYGIHSYMADKVMLISKSEIELRIGLLSEQDKHYITFGAYRKRIKFNIGDKVSLLFGDDEIWEIEIENKGYRVDKDSDGVIFEAKEEIDLQKISKLATTPLKKWRYYDIKAERAYTSILDGLYNWTTERRNIQELAQMMQIAIKEL